MAKTLTIGEQAEVEGIAGLPLEAMGDPATPKAKLIVGLVFVLMKRKNPDFTLKEAYAMDVEDAAQVIEEYFGTDEDPKA